MKSGRRTVLAMRCLSSDISPDDAQRTPVVAAPSASALTKFVLTARRGQSPSKPTSAGFLDQSPSSASVFNFSELTSTALGILSGFTLFFQGFQRLVNAFDHGSGRDRGACKLIKNTAIFLDMPEHLGGVPETLALKRKNPF